LVKNVGGIILGAYEKEETGMATKSKTIRMLVIIGISCMTFAVWPHL
jgi:hypothetical protein